MMEHIDLEQIPEPIAGYHVIDGLIANLLFNMKTRKPNDRSEDDRRFAIAITEVEKLRAFWLVYFVADLLIDND